MVGNGGIEEKTQKGIIADANVLIDYTDCNPEILRLASLNLGQLFAASTVLREVDQLSQSAAKK